jgi:putative exporter of polyketide antibiotics
MKRIFSVMLAMSLLLVAALGFGQAPNPLEGSAFAVWVMAHAAGMFTTLAIVGALVHYGKKRGRGETASGLFEYFTMDNPVHSAGLGAALLLAIWAAYSTDLLTGASATAIITMGFLAGWTLDSGVNKGKP